MERQIVESAAHIISGNMGTIQRNQPALLTLFYTVHFILLSSQPHLPNLPDITLALHVCAFIDYSDSTYIISPSWFAVSRQHLQALLPKLLSFLLNSLADIKT